MSNNNCVRKKYLCVVLLGLIALSLAACSSRANDDKIHVKVLILPKFEVGEMSGDFPGEAQYYYEEYVEGGDVYDLENGTEGTKIYVKDDIALCLVGEGKVNSTLNTTALLSDERFDFSDAYILSTGCAGSAYEYGVMGDVYVISSAVDFDLGHHADPRELDEASDITWFHDSEFDDSAFVKLDPELTDRVYDLVKDVKPETTENTKQHMKNAFPGEEWAEREPMVLKGASVTGDNYWKGMYDHKNAVLLAETYDCPDPYAVTEMEDVAVSNVVEAFDMLDRYMIIRDSVNMDVFMLDATPESLWGKEVEDEISSDDSAESLDIFPTAMKNNFEVGKIVIEAIMNDDL